jgi:hypothetical protein
MTWWMWYAAGIGTVVAALMLAALVSRWLSRQHPTHRAGIDEDEDDPEPVLRIDPSLYPRRPISTVSMGDLIAPDEETPPDPQPTDRRSALRSKVLRPYPETSRLLPGPPSGGRRDEELAGGDAETRTRPADESHPPR